MSETPTKWETWHTQSPLADSGDYMYSCGITNGVNYLYLQDETDEDEILPELCKQLNSFEEREALLKEMAEMLSEIKLWSKIKDDTFTFTSSGDFKTRIKNLLSKHTS